MSQPLPADPDELRLLVRMRAAMHASAERDVTELWGRLRSAEAAVTRARALASRWAVLRTHGSAATELRAALADVPEEAPAPFVPFAHGFRIHLRHQVLNGVLLPSGRCLVVEDAPAGLITAAPSVEDLVRGYPDARIEWPRPSTTQKDPST